MLLPLFKESPGRAADVRSLEDTLKRSVEGEVRFDATSRAAYSTDASNYRRVPAGVVTPRSADDVAAVMAACREHGVPVVSRGGGTSLNGQCCTTGVVMDCSKHFNRIVDVDLDARTARVQPGVVYDSLAERTLPHDLLYAADPATHSHCTFGGMLGNNSCGIHSVYAGRASDNVQEMEVITSDGVQMRVGPTDADAMRRLAQQEGRAGAIYAGLDRLCAEYGDDIRTRFPDIPRCVSGYNLPELLDENGGNVAKALVGSEATCVTILEATVRLLPWPHERILLVLGYTNIFEAGDHVPEILEAGPIGLEGMDRQLIERMRTKGLGAAGDIGLLPEGGG